MRMNAAAPITTKKVNPGPDHSVMVLPKFYTPLALLQYPESGAMPVSVIAFYLLNPNVLTVDNVLEF